MGGSVSIKTLEVKSGTDSMANSRIIITATFTAEVLKLSLEYWMKRLGFTEFIEFAPYNQVFQQLLNPSSDLCRNESGANVVLVRLEDWMGKDQSLQHLNDAMRINVRDFVGAMKSVPNRNKVPYLVFICPSSPKLLEDVQRAGILRQLQDLLMTELVEENGIHVTGTEELFQRYPVQEYYDVDAEEIGHIPYTDEFFAGLGTSIARKILALRSVPFKVIVLDCDETLWKGVCGEDGPMGIELDSSRLVLQRFMLERRNAGMLLCLCSKNNEEDVLEVFRQRKDFPLKLNHFAARKINWKSKSENLRALASELRLGIDSFIFLDDNEVECGEVRANCPDVLCLQLPKDPQLIPKFLNHIWALDIQNSTDEDRNRTISYQQNSERERLRNENLSFKDFLRNLELDVQIKPLTKADFRRASQLTQRVNQFNASTVRRSVEEFERLLISGELECLTVTVKDRFGDYGMVGLMLFREDSKALHVDTFLLSCRALGRGVEHHMLARLGEVASSRAIDYVDFQYIRTKKNQPALNFLLMVSGNSNGETERDQLFRVPVGSLNEIIQKLGEHAEAASTAPTEHVAADSQLTGSELGIESRPDLYRRIASQLSDVGSILDAIQEAGMRVRKIGDDSVIGSYSPVEQTIVDVWKEVLRIEGISREDGFFELGGHSLQATQVISRLRKIFQTDLTLTQFFDKPTVKQLADFLEHQQIEQAAPEDLAELLEDLEGMSEEEAIRLLSSESHKDQDLSRA